MLLTINTALTPASYPGERLSQEIYEYVWDELKPLRDKTEKHALHNKLELDVTFAGGRHKTIVRFRLVVHFRDVEGHMEFKDFLEVAESALPVAGTLTGLLMSTIEKGIPETLARIVVETAKVTDTFRT